jgi:hypothetical protein
LLWNIESHAVLFGEKKKLFNHRRGKDYITIIFPSSTPIVKPNSTYASEWLWRKLPSWQDQSDSSLIDSDSLTVLCSPVGKKNKRVKGHAPPHPSSKV